ncbi:unnamed protein product [Zymoseptoria tritici ST99CH_1A5]|uniref:Uncharacterized protein n=3 Tax=Zymoseptoria tritici TaxID=1047171 RepID=F9XCM7_ZYMTI|nr:uncharacterized protein MYCGRDRAFT_93287 [Zymoseptoria tritici IPO323]EGP87565.1 hypothetical protein MYCGRDRAFT_93287 [Zymoseptoria tritici IPO323]SMR52844.1 unnamed protein product [Zymoseptoria tritici ST99CH_1E4]SMY24587.1 unnamed protein product [Zymoseptoria tritici ST99CH_1A5]
MDEGNTNSAHGLAGMPKAKGLGQSRKWKAMKDLKKTDPDLAQHLAEDAEASSKISALREQQAEGKDAMHAHQPEASQPVVEKPRIELASQYDSSARQVLRDESQEPRKSKATADRADDAASHDVDHATAASSEETHRPR